MITRSWPASKRLCRLLNRSLSSSSKNLKSEKDPVAQGYIRHQHNLAGTPQKPPSPTSTAAPQTAAPVAAGSGGAAAGPPTPSTSWQLHPSFPIDTRLLGAGIFGLGTFIYSISGDGSTSQPPPPSSHNQSGEAEAHLGELSSSLSDQQAGANEQDMESKSTADSGDVSVVKSDEESAAGEESKNMPVQEEGAAQDTIKEEPTIIDSHEILGVIEDVFSKPADVMLRDDEAAVSGSGNLAAHKEPSSPGKERTDSHRTSAVDGLAAADDTSADIAAAQIAITSAMSDSSGYSVASDIGKTPLSHQTQPDAHPTATQPQRPLQLQSKPLSDGIVGAAAALAGVDPKDFEALGVKADLTAAGLISEAARRGAGPGDDWQQYSARHRQAEADAAVLADMLASAAQHVREKISSVESVAAANKAEADAARAAAAAQADRFRSALGDALRAAEEGHEQRMNAQAEQLAVAHAEMTVRERAERQAKVDALRLRLGALEAALHKRSEAARGSHAAHQLAQGVFALRAALDAGNPADGASAFLKKACGTDDALVAAAIKSLPQGTPLPTLAQLQSEFTHVERAAKELSALPKERGGMLSAAAAKLAARLKVSERVPQASALPGGGVDAALAGVRHEVEAGDLLHAATGLQNAVQGTAAERAVADWVQLAKARATAEQAAALLEAHAAVATASLA